MGAQLAVTRAPLREESYSQLCSPATPALPAQPPKVALVWNQAVQRSVKVFFLKAQLNTTVSQLVTFGCPG